MFNTHGLSRYVLPVSALLSKIARLVAVFYLMSLLEPEKFSEWILISLILQYSLFLQLGIPAPTSRELSIAFGKKDVVKIVSVSSLSLQVFLISSAVLYFIISHFYSESYSSKLFWYVTLSHGGALLCMQARSTFQNHKVIISHFLEALIILIGLAYMGRVNPLQNLITIYLIAGFMTCLVCFPPLNVVKATLSFFTINIPALIKLLKFAMPLLAFTFLMLFKSTWDILGVKYFEIEGSTIYISSQIFSDCVRILSALIAMVYVPYLAKTFGGHQERISESLLSELHRYQLVSVSIFFTGVIFLYPIMYFGASYFYPEYSHVTSLYFLRTIAVLLSIVSLPRLLFLITIRKPLIGIIIASGSILIGGLSAFVFSYYFSLYSALSYALMLSNIACFFITHFWTQRIIDRDLMMNLNERNLL
jgi:hypothetical protein